MPKPSFLKNPSDTAVHTLPKGIWPIVNVTERLEFELAYYNSAGQCFSHYTTSTSPRKEFIIFQRVFVRK